LYHIWLCIVYISVLPVCLGLGLSDILSN